MTFWIFGDKSSEKIRLGISCVLSATIHTKCQALFPKKNVFRESKTCHFMQVITRQMIHMKCHLIFSEKHKQIKMTSATIILAH